MGGMNTAPERPSPLIGETRTVGVSFAGKLDDGELLTGTPTADEQTTSDLTITSVAVNTTALTINHETVAVGEAVTFLVKNHKAAGSPYTVLVKVSTDATPAQTLWLYTTFNAVDI